MSKKPAPKADKKTFRPKNRSRSRANRKAAAFKAATLVILAALIASLLAGAASADEQNRAIDEAASRAERLGRLFNSPDAGDILKVAVLKELTEPAPLPPAPTVIPDPTNLDLIAAWEGENGIEVLDDATQGQVVEFLRQAARSKTLRDSLPGGGTVNDNNSPRRPAADLVCPIRGEVRFINDWGFPRSGGRQHRGNDLFALEGTPIVAVRPGIITSISRVDRGLGGLHVTYIDDRGDRWYNAHLSHVADGLKVGDRIQAGQLVGYVGRTGNARTTPPHNHIQWHPGNGLPENPYFRLRAAC